MTDSASYSVWNNFFLSAGIPSTVANEYAVTFTQHRIRIDMLKEITKEILLDMGIKAMGDIIAILRHAKNLYTQDELNGRTKTTSASVGAPTIVNPPRQIIEDNHLSQRTSISTSRPSTSISPLVGNKIRSRLSLNSGALVASSNQHSISHQRNSNVVVSAKRPTSTISASLAKRLRPAGTQLPEKTLTVRYPPKSAIVRAQQRIKSKSSSSSSMNTSNRNGRGAGNFNGKL